MLVLTEYPRQCPPRAWPNLILSAKGNEVAYSQRSGPLSVKAVFSGVEVHEVNGARFAVNAHNYLILNQGQRYSSYAAPPGAIETLSIFFAPDFAQGVLGSLVTPSDRLLDSLLETQQVCFFERLYPHDQTVTPLLERIRYAVQSGGASAEWLEDQFGALLEHLLWAHRNLYKEILRMPPLRLATKAEIFRRLYRARDFMESTCHQRLTLGEIAKVACLSPHHFLRLFKTAFGETPHRFLVRLRLERTRALLLESDRSVTDICFDSGFNSLGSFSSLFKRRYGCSPRALREKVPCQ